jgi:malate dehydrogenase (oxaloacetate-decarboxylating)
MLGLIISLLLLHTQLLPCSDGTRVIGLGSIGPEGALPVMDGKSILFKVLGNINAILNSDQKEYFEPAER